MSFVTIQPELLAATLSAGAVSYATPEAANAIAAG
jgi:hypothetical protein